MYSTVEFFNTFIALLALFISIGVFYVTEINGRITRYFELLIQSKISFYASYIRQIQRNQKIIMGFNPDKNFVFKNTSL